MNQTTTVLKRIGNLTPDILKILWKRGEIGEISPLFHNILLSVVRFSCLNRDPLFTSRKAVIRDKRSRGNESRVYMHDDCGCDKDLCVFMRYYRPNNTI